MFKSSIRLLTAVFLLLGIFYLVSCKQKTDYKKITHDPLFYTNAMHELNYVIIYDIFTPPVASRVFAYSNMAAYEVLSKEGKHFLSLEGKVKGLKNIPDPKSPASIDYPFASVIALLKVGEALTFSHEKMKQVSDSLLKVVKESNMGTEMYQSSIAYGQQVGDSILSWSKSDNYAQTRGSQFTVSHLEGHWIPTPPGYFNAVEPLWKTIRCIAMDSSNEISVPGPPPFSKQPGSVFYKMVKQVMDTSANLDTTKKWIANFWDCNSFKLHVQGHVMFATKAMTPPGHWMEITGIVSEKQKADFYQTVYAYTGVSIGMFDAFIASWYCKYKYDLIRPETFINKYIDPNWMPYLQTPPFPEYNSAHSTISSSAATILGRIYGPQVAFRDSSERNWGWPDRSFRSLDDAAMEVSMSRFYGGIHYLPSVLDAYEQGKKLGNIVVDRLLTKKEK